MKKWVLKALWFAFLLWGVFMSGCTKDDPPDTEAPVIILKQSSLSIEAGDQIVPGSLVLSITDNKDQNPQITASIDNQTIAYQEAYTFSKAGDFDLRIKASDKSGNSSLSQVAINVGAWLPALLGLDSLQHKLDPRTNIPMDLLFWIQAIDVKDGNITQHIKVFLKNNENLIEIQDPNKYIVKETGPLTIVYQIKDSNGNLVSAEVIITIQSGAPRVTGIENLSKTIQAHTGVPMDLLNGIEATDCRNEDITQNIKVFLKNTDGTYAQIENPRIYTANAAGIIQLKYEISDKYGNTVVSETSLTVKQGIAIITGLDKLPETLKPTTGLPMNLLSWIQATDLKNQDITWSIKVFFKNIDGTYIQITNPTAYMTMIAWPLSLKYQVTDSYWNSSSAEISLNIVSWAPTLTGITNLQTALSPRTGLPMNLLTGIKATDLKNQDITKNIKVFLKNAAGTFTQITNPTTYTVTTAGIIQLKYEINDSYGHKVDEEISLNIISWAPTLTGITNLQTALNPKTGLPMDLLTGIKATDLKNQDITWNIKVFLKNADGIFTQITNPTTYTVSTAGLIYLKYEVSDSYGQKTDTEISLNIVSWAPTLTGITNLQTAVNPKTGLPMDLLTGIKATDLKDQDITVNIKVFLKNTDGNYTQISTPKSYSTKTVGKIVLKYQVNDSYENQTSTETALTIASGVPILTGLDNLQTAVNPKVGIPMNLLTGIKATDVKNQDISNKIKVFHKIENETFSEITNPASHIVSVAGNLVLKYQVTDSYDQTTELQKTLNVVAEVLTIPKMQIMPTDPTFNPNNPDWHFNAVRNWTDYLKTLNIPEVWAMGEAMVRSGTNDMPKTEYLSKLNKRQIALNNAAGIPMSTDTEGQYVVPVTAFPQTNHEDICNQILLGKKNNGVWSTGIIWPLIQQWGVNKAIRIEDGSTDLSNWYNVTKPIKQRLQINPDKYLIISTSANVWGLREDIADILSSGRVIWFQSAGNVMIWQGQKLSISVTEESSTWDPREIRNMPWAYDIGKVTIPIQRVGGCWEDFTVNVANQQRSWGVGTTYLTWDQKNIRYAPWVHAYYNNQRNNLGADKEAFTSIATPVQAGLLYLLTAAYPEKSPWEILDLAANEYSHPVKVSHAEEPTRWYTSKTTNIGKVYKDLNSKVPEQISLSASPIPIPKGRYKFNIIYGEGVSLANGNKITNADLNNTTKRGTLTQENYVIDPSLLKSLGKKAGDEIIIHVSVCSDAFEEYKQIWDIEYRVRLVN